MDNYTSRQAEFMSLTLSAQDFLDTVPAGALAVDAQGSIVGLNAELVRQFGYQRQDLLGRSIEVLVPAGLRHAHVAMRSKLFAPDQIRAMGTGRPLQGQRRDGSVFPIEVGLRAIEAGGERFVLAVVSDRSDRLRTVALEAEHKALGLELGHQEVVAQEMGHRVKNLMATVNALISLSSRGATSPKQMEESLRGRVLALSMVIDLAFQMPRSAASHGSLSIEAILRAVFAPFMWTAAESERVSLHGPALVVGQRPSEVLALVFHELLTNALKYGALLHPDGLIAVTWHEADGQLDLRWCEQAQQFRASLPGTKGLGTTLMSRLIENDLGGRIEREVAPAGWMTHLSIPARSLGL